MTRDEASLHLSGRTQFIDDLPEPAGLLHGAPVCAVKAHARLACLDLAAARAADGVHAVLIAKDIPGINQIGRIIQDEPLLAGDFVHYVGQPIALVLADSPMQARRAARLIHAEYETKPACFDPVSAHSRGQLIAPSRTIATGDVDAALAACAHVVAGSCVSDGQEHLYLETQGTIAWPVEGGRVKITAGTQSPTGVQQVVARVLGLPMHAIEVEVARLGGAFGGKEDQATPWAALCALGAWLTLRPVKLVLTRHEDMRFTGKRHPYHSRYRIGLDAQGKIVAYEATFFQNAGAAADLSTSVLERSLLHATGPYFIPHVRVTGHSCRTNLPPFTAFRGFGAPQGVFVIECAITHAARAIGMPPERLREINLIQDGESFYFGMPAQKPLARAALERLTSLHDIAGMRAAARTFNATSALVKRGVAVVPIAFGIAFTSKFLNQAGALVHIYFDGSVHVSSGAVEMGQGVNRKLSVIAARALGIDPMLVTVAATNTTRVPNTSPTAASSGTDLNGGAVRLACATLQERLLVFAATKFQLAPGELRMMDGRLVNSGGSVLMEWHALIDAAYLNRVDLSAHAHYVTEGLDYDRMREQGTPFAYHVYGACVTEVEVDMLRGTFRLAKVGIVHDAGRHLVRDVDLGQVEGALVQGIGWATVEHLCYDAEGRLASSALASYKVPDLRFMPADLTVSFLECSETENRSAVYHSKGVGEPPFLYGLATYFALWDALGPVTGDFNLPFSNERIMAALPASAPSPSLNGHGVI